MKLKHYRISAFLMAFVFLFSLFQNFGFKLEDHRLIAGAVTYVGNCGENCKWDLDLATGTLTISGYGKTDDFNDENVTPWYKYSDNIEKIVVGDGIDVIGAELFSKLHRVKSAVIASSVLQISDKAFYACSNLVKISAKDSKLENIGDNAFAYCRKLRFLPVLSCLKLIGENAFFYCYGLSEVTLPFSTSNIGKDAFECCTSLSKLRIVNYNCEIFDSETTFYKNTCIEGFNNSTAKAYCDKYAKSFKRIREIKYLNDLKITPEYSSVKYDGKKKTPSVSIRGLKKGKDFVLKYSDNIKPGIASITVKGIGKTLGEKTLNFKILPEKVGSLTGAVKRNSVSLSWKKVYGAKEYEVFMRESGKWSRVGTAKGNTFTVKSLKSASKYLFKVRAVCGVNNDKCCGKFSTMYKVITRPGIPAINNISSVNGGKKLKISIDKLSGVSGYELFMSSQKNGDYKKAADIKNGKRVSVMIGDINKSRKYYFKVRSYINKDGSAVYSNFSEIYFKKFK